MNLEKLRQMVEAGDHDAPFLAKKLGTEALDVLIEAMASPTPRVRLVAINSLSEIDDPAVARACVRALEDPSEAVRTQAVNALWATPDPAVVPALLEKLSSLPSLETRRDVPMLVGLAGGPDAVPALRKALSDEADPETRHNISLALARLGDPEHVKAARERLALEPVAALLEAVRESAYTRQREVGAALAPLLEDRRPAYMVGKSAQRREARICDAAMIAAKEIFGSEFPVEADSQSVFTDEEIDAARRFFDAMASGPKG